jgi:hypothetical protein
LSFFIDSPYLKTVDEDGIISQYAKSTLCWILEEKRKLPNDRSRRYIYDNGLNMSQAEIEAKLVYQKDFLSRADFVIFKENDKYLIGEILNLQNLDGSTKKARRIAKKFCNRRFGNVGVLANWYLILMNGTLIPIVMNEYQDASSYLCHANPNFFDTINNTVTAELLESMFDLEDQIVCDQLVIKY